MGGQNLPSASAVERAMRCPASCVLPQARLVGEVADLGTAVHRFVEAVRARAQQLAEGGSDYAHALDEARTEELQRLTASSPPEGLLEIVEALDLTRIPREARSEVAFAWSLQTGEGRVLGEALDRDYSSVRDDEIPGTADLAWPEEGRAVIWDLKTGKSLGPAARNWQLRTLALAACRAWGLDEADAKLVYLRSDGHSYVDRAVFDAFDLSAFAADLQLLAERIARAGETVEAGRPPDVELGPWCRYCPALASCPGQTTQLRALVADATQGLTEQAVQQRICQLAPAHVGEAWLRLRGVAEVVKWTNDAIEAYVRQHTEGIHLLDGQMLREVVRSREYLVGTVAAQVLTERHGEELMRACVSFDPSTSKTAIGVAFRSRGLKTKDATAAIDAIRAAGGVEIRTSRHVKPVDVDEK